MSRLLDWAVLVTALGCALSAGALFAFSSFVMPALNRLPAAQAIAAMHSINRRALTPAFMTAFVGTAVACIGVAIWAAVDGDAVGWTIAGAALYVLGTVGLTRAANVPLNEALDTVPAESPDAERRWRDYSTPWTAWNHVRVAAGIVAAGLLIVALVD